MKQEDQSQVLTESDVSFREDTDEKIDKCNIEGEDRNEHLKRSTKEAGEYLMKTQISW